MRDDQEVIFNSLLADVDPATAYVASMPDAAPRPQARNKEFQIGLLIGLGLFVAWVVFRT
jgi:hypothetical protein